MPNPPNSSSLPEYFTAISSVFDLQKQILSGVLPHYGERGTNDEERLTSFLRPRLPMRFGLGTGFVACSDGDQLISRQTDIIVFDAWNNAPLASEASSSIFAIESVCATIEVKGKLNDEGVRQTCQAIGELRRMAKHRWEARPNTVKTRKGSVVDEQAEKVDRQPPPRTFLFAYQTEWQNIDALQQSLARHAERYKAHLHGVAVIEKDWFLTQVPYSKPPGTFQIEEDHALMRFVRKLIFDSRTAPTYSVPYSRYMNELDSSIHYDDEECSGP